jgi:hypothetical protein
MHLLENVDPIPAPACQRLASVGDRTVDSLSHGSSGGLL